MKPVYHAKTAEAVTLDLVPLATLNSKKDTELFMDVQF